MKIKMKKFRNSEFEFRILETNLSELSVSAVKPDSTAEAQRRGGEFDVYDYVYVYEWFVAGGLKAIGYRL